MFQLLQGWKLRVGIVTLFVACLFAAGWVRSRWTSDSLEIPLTDGSVQMLRSNFGHIELLRWTGREFPRLKWNSFTFSGPAEYQLTWLLYREMQVQEDHGPDTSLLATEGRYLPNKISTGKGISIPYRSVVVPLVVISAWLLLSGMRRLK